MRNLCKMFLKNNTFINGNLKQAGLQVRSVLADPFYTHTKKQLQGVSPHLLV